MAPGTRGSTGTHTGSRLARKWAKTGEDVLTVLLALLVVVLAVAPFLLAFWLMARTRRRTGFDDEIARLVDDTRWPGPSR